jgi:hypothetical protein
MACPGDRMRTDELPAPCRKCETAAPAGTRSPSRTWDPYCLAAAGSIQVMTRSSHETHREKAPSNSGGHPQGTASAW